MIEILKKQKHKNREYVYANTHLGNVVFYEIGKYITYKNISEGSIFWSIVSKEKFKLMFESPPVEIYVDKRISGLEKATKVNSSGNTYHLARKKNYDNYIYEIAVFMHKIYPKSKYPDMKFVYTKYYVPAIKELDKLTIERLKIEEINKFNGHSNYDVSGVSNIIDKLYEMVD